MILNKRLIAGIAGASAVAIATFTAGFEGLANKVYRDPVGHMAVCVGHDSYAPDGTPLKLGEVYTDGQCSALLGWDLKTAGSAVDKLVRVPLNEGERLAYTDFVFNVGVDAFAKSTALRKLNSGDRAGACAELLRWNKGTVGGKLVVLPGLDRRRKAEREACVTGKPPA